MNKGIPDVETNNWNKSKYEERYRQRG